MNRSSFFLLTFLSSFFFSQCKESCHEVLSLREYYFHFTLIDSVKGTNLLPKVEDMGSNSYNIDSIAFYDKDFNRIYPFTFFYDYSGNNTGGYTIEVSYLSPEAGVDDPYLPDSATYFLYLNALDTDTISVVYDHDPGKDKCLSSTNKFEVYFNGQQIERFSTPPYPGQYLFRK